MVSNYKKISLWVLLALNLSLAASKTPLHRIVSISSSTPWHLVLERPQNITFSRLQVVQQNGEIQTILADTIISQKAINLSALIPTWINPLAQHKVRLANALNQHPQSTQNNSWVSQPLFTTKNSISGAQLRSPQNKAKILRQQNPILNFSWRPLSKAVLYQVQLARKTETGWRIEKYGSTADSSWTISHKDLQGGEWRWTVSNQDQNLHHGISETWYFSLDEQRKARKFEFVRPQGEVLQPVAFGEMQISTKDGYPPQHALSDSHGLLNFWVNPGKAQISIIQAGFKKQTLNLDIPSSGTVCCTLHSSKSIIKGFINNHLGLPQGNLHISASNNLGDTVHTVSQNNGAYKLSIDAGTWDWKVRNYNGTVLLSQSLKLAQEDTVDLGIQQLNINNCAVNFKLIADIKAFSSAHLKLYDKQGQTVNVFSSNKQGSIPVYAPCENWSYSIHAPHHFPVYAEANFRNTASINHQLTPGQALISGKVRTIEEAELDKKTEQLEHHAEIWAYSLHHKNLELRSQTNAQGEYALDLPIGGQWVIQAKTKTATSPPDTVSFVHSIEHIQKDLVINLEARVEGYLLAPQLKDQQILVELWQADSLQQKVFATFQSTQKWFYGFRNISPGNYFIRAQGLNWKSADVPVEVLFIGGFTGKGTVIVPDISLQKYESEFVAYPLLKDFSIQELKASMQLHYPNSMLNKAPDTIPVSPGTLIYSLIPDSSDWIPLWQHERTISTEKQQQDSIAFPAVHIRPPPVSQAKKSTAIPLNLELYNQVDSAFLWVKPSNGPAQRILAHKNEVHQILFNYTTSNFENQLDYWFEVYSQGMYFANPYPSKHFSLEIDYASEPFKLQIESNDTIYMPVEVTQTFKIKAQTPHKSLSHKLSAESLECSLNNPELADIKIEKDLLQIKTLQKGSTKLLCNSKIANHQSQESRAIVIAEHAPNNGEFSLKISKNEQVLGGDTLILTANILDSLGNTWNAPLGFTIEPKFAATKIENNILYLRSDFIGPINFSAQSYHHTDTLEINVAGIANAKQSHRFFHDSTLAVYVDSATWSDNQNKLIYLQKFDNMQRLRYHLDSIELKTPLYNTAYDVQNSIKPLFLEFNIEDSQNHNLKLIDTAALTIQAVKPKKMARIKVEDELKNSLETVHYDKIPWLRVACEKESPAFYALATTGQSILQASLDIIPNPFSPYVTALIDGNNFPGTAVRYTPYIAGYNSVQVQIRIYNMTGDEVRTLVHNQDQSPANYSVAWDGLDKYDNMVRNGRYLVVLELKNPHNAKLLQKLVKAVVVFK